MQRQFRPIRSVTPTAPGYREAYPRLNIAAAERAMEGGREICVYTRGRRRLGHIECDVEGDDWFVLKYQIIPDNSDLTYESSLVAFRHVTHSKSAVGWKRYLLCPVCTRQRQSLYFARAWACAECHKLLRRSQVIPARVSLAEREAELAKQVGRGKPLGMHASTYSRLRAELEEARNKLRTRPLAVPAEAHCRVVQEDWRSQEEDADWQGGLPPNWWLPDSR